VSQMQQTIEFATPNADVNNSQTNTSAHDSSTLTGSIRRYSSSGSDRSRRVRKKARTKSYAERRCEKLNHWRELIIPTEADNFFTQAVILAFIVGLGGRYSGYKWMSPGQLRGIYSYEDVAKYSGFDLLCSHSEVGLDGNKFAKNRAGRDRGRALGVIMRWTLTKKVGKLYLQSQGKMESRESKWLRDLPPGQIEFPAMVNDTIDHVEHLQRVKDGMGGFELIKRTWSMVPDEGMDPDDTSEEFRCVMSHVRCEHVTHIISMRAQFFNSLKQGGGLGVVQKILLIDAGRDVTPDDGYEVVFADKNDRSSKRRVARELNDVERGFIHQVEKAHPGSVKRETESGVLVYAREPSLYISLYNAFIDAYREVDREKVIQNFPIYTKKRVAKTRNVSMHHAAIDALMLYTGNETRSEFLRSHSQSLRAVQLVTLAISGLYRLAFDKERIPLEEESRGCVGIVAGGKHEISVFNGRGAKTVPAFRTSEEEKLFSLPYKQYVQEKMEDDYYEGKYRQGIMSPM